jgi:acryloyl-coenzyme A reductase
MRAVVLRQAGPPEALHVEDVDMPVCGRGDVLIEVRACGVAHRDVVERNGTYQRDVVFPLIMGLEISGVIAELGAEVRDLKVGDHVCTKAFSSCGRCYLCRSGRETTCWERVPVRGGYAEYVALPWDAVLKVPDNVPFEQSCGLGPSAGVALNAVRDTLHVTLGDWVLVTGASGGVGFAAMQLAKLAGARVIAATRSRAKGEMLLQHGADNVAISGSPDFVSHVRALTDGRGVDAVVDNVGSRVFAECYDSLAVHGRYAFVGQLFRDSIEINPARIFFKRAALFGVGSVSRAQLTAVIDLASRGLLTTVISSVMPLEAAAEAHRIVEDGLSRGRVILDPRS